MSNSLTEHEQLVALICSDIDLIFEVAQRHPEGTILYFETLKERKDKLLSDAVYREERYRAACSPIVDTGDFDDTISELFI